MLNYNKTNMLRFIAQLLHPTNMVDISYFPASQSFCETLVKLGSDQLILPAIYSAIKRKGLEENFPKDLLSYLHKISDLNQNRNISILKQIDFLSNVFKKHQIEYVFLKGAAMLIAKPYDTLNERMIGDIDILVSEKHLLNAQELLLREGFKLQSNKFNFTKNLDYVKHLERIIHPKFIAAVEIHRNLFDNKLKSPILPLDVLKEKSQNANQQFIPSKQHLWMHAILNWQYNDCGMIMNSLAFRNIVDVLYLEPKDLTEKLKTSSNAIKCFYSLLSVYYDSYPTFNLIKKLRYKWQLRYSFINKFNKLYFKIVYLFSLICLRFRSKIYLKRVLNNPKLSLIRIFKFFKK